MTVTAADIAAARPAVRTIARHTPVLSSRTFSERSGGEVLLKAENLQRTGSFKVRGAAAKLRALGVACEVFVPDDAPISKVEAMGGQGAKVHRGGAAVDECVARAQEYAAENGMAFVHPFDDADVVAGQGSIGLELLEDVPDLGKVVVPVGGGGLASGLAIAIKSQRPDVQVVGVQAAACAPYAESLRRGEAVPAATSLTIADGIAVKRPGDLTLPLLGEWLDDLVTVGEDEIAEAMFLCLERAKLVVEGAGAVGVAALLGGQVRPAARGSTLAVLSGGNVDANLLGAIARRHESQLGRRLVIFTKVPDRPGALAVLLQHVAETGANIVDVSHVREGVDLHVRETAVELVIETRGPDHAEAVLGDLGAAGYETRVLR